MFSEHTRQNNHSYDADEKLSPKKSVVIIIEDSSYYRQLHQRHLTKLNVESIVFSNVVNFNKQIAQIIENNSVISIITDGLHGDWPSIYYIARDHNINKIWLVSDNKHMLDNSTSYPYIKAVSKRELQQNPDIYQILSNKR